MGPWLQKKSVSRVSERALEQSGRSPVKAMNSIAESCAPRFESLESRVFLSAAPYDLTNSYAGSATFKYGKHKVKEALTLSLTSESSSGFVSGQISSTHFGTVNVSGQITGKTFKLLGTTSGREIIGKIAKHGLSLSGTTINGSDDSTGKFKIKSVGDASAAVASAAAAAAANTTTAGPTARALTATAATTGTGLDSTIDPTTGLPIDPTTGLPVDPSQTPGDTGTGDTTTTPPDDTVTTPTLPSDFPTPTSDGGTTVTAPDGSVPQDVTVGDMIGNNFTILGVWVGTFNDDGTGSIDDPNTPGATLPIEGTTPGTDPRSATFTTTTQDTSGLVTGTLDVELLGSFVYTGFVNGAHIDLVLSGTSVGATNGTVSLDLDSTTFDNFSGHLNANANTYVADGPINATFQSDIPTLPVPLPDGEELYHVDPTDSAGDPTFGNFDPAGASIGEDFSVGNTPLIINSLGAFDGGADGLTKTIRVAIYNTDDPTTALVVSNITTANSELDTNSSFRYLTTFTPITLTTGIYRIVAFGYGDTELAGDIGVDNYQGPVPVANSGTTNEIQYPISNDVNGNSYLSDPPDTLPGTLTYPTNGQGLPINRYLAGSFLFELGTPTDPNGGGSTPTPTPTTTLTKPANSAFPGGVLTNNTGQTVFGSQSGGIIAS